MSGRTEATVVIDASMDVVWDMTNDLENWPNLFTEYAKVEVLERDGDTVRFRLTMHPDENGSVHAWESERTADPKTRTVRARRVESHAFDYMNIYWDYTEHDGGVQMRWVQEFHVNEAMSYGDEEMAAHLKKNTAIQMAAIKQRIEEAAAGR
ncbi:SRPBCC family protein [Nonomuraea antimicrobica]|uniref:SRPBCC family protein n=1 Tax=Nonomuraea antimicrobica TaxID=561173 RepID=A0ABP7DAB3_9ACTN